MHGHLTDILVKPHFTNKSSYTVYKILCIKQMVQTLALLLGPEKSRTINALEKLKW